MLLEEPVYHSILRINSQRYIRASRSMNTHVCIPLHRLSPSAPLSRINARHGMQFRVCSQYSQARCGQWVLSGCTHRILCYYVAFSRAYVYKFSTFSRILLPCSIFPRIRTQISLRRFLQILYVCTLGCRSIEREREMERVGEFARSQRQCKRKRGKRGIKREVERESK